MATDDEIEKSEVHIDLRSFGRRRGRKLSPRQQRLMDELLPRVRCDVSSLPTLQGREHRATACHPGRSGSAARAGAQSRDPGTRTSSVAPGSRLARGGGDDTPHARELWLEIGFGGAEHLIWQARANPGVTIIGCEPFEEGVVKALAAIEEHNLQNVRLHPDDARDVLRALPDASLARAFILFPDPWPKKRHVKRRLINARLMADLARVLMPGAELRIGTDIGDYARTILMALQAEPRFLWAAQAPRDWRVRPSDWPQTRYEQKALREGRRCVFLRFVRRHD